MTWEVHEGRKQKDAPSELKLSPLHGVSEPTCGACAHHSSNFMFHAAEAVKHARLKPDDQIWLSVFNALQEMLAHRAICTLSDPGRTDRKQPLNYLSESAALPSRIPAHHNH